MSIEKKIKRIAYGYDEGQINFAPTYKINKGTNVYSSKRNPAWTDRILFRSNQGILKQVNYESHNLVRESDHRPVFAQFLMHFNKFDVKNFNRV